MADHCQKRIFIGQHSVDVDERIADDIMRINAQGMRTAFSCQGDEGPYNIGIAYVAFVDSESPAIKHVTDIAIKAGMKASDNGNGLCVYSKPGVHGDAVREHCTEEDLLRWNAQFRLFLSDLANDTVDKTGERYHVEMAIHPCTIITKQDFVDNDLLPAYRKWTDLGGEMTDFCQGDTVKSRTEVVMASARWTPPKDGVPKDLTEALTAIGWSVHNWGTFTSRKNRVHHGGYGIHVTESHLLAMNLAYQAIFADFAAGDVCEPQAYMELLANTQRWIQKPTFKKPGEGKRAHALTR
jgi:hypothetical protein